MDFASPSAHGFARVAAVTLPVHPGDPAANAEETVAALRALDRAGCAVAAFPELGLSGYALDDLFTQEWLAAEVLDALARVRRASRALATLAVVGAPLRWHQALYNCAVFVRAGRILRVAAKSYLPTYREFYEARYFAPLEGEGGTITLDGQQVPFGQGVVRVEQVPGLAVGAEICEDMWAPRPVGGALALSGANVIVNLSASPVMVSRARERELMVASSSSRLQCAYVYTAAGNGESSTDLAWDGQTLIYQQGRRLAAGRRFPRRAGWVLADVDLRAIAYERQANTTFRAQRRHIEPLPVTTSAGPTPVIPAGPPQNRVVRRFPFVPDDAASLEQDCYEAYNIQVYGLVKRLQAIGGARVVIGVSGGLDSTHALIVAARALDLLERPRSDILAYTLPGFATSAGTKNNAYRLCASLGIDCAEIDIRAAARQMLTDMDHPYARALAAAGGDQDALDPAVYDVAFENVQAGLRTDYLFRIANARGGIVLGTGDLSELALGWCTYGVGDQMSHYAVNCGVPKTLIQHLIRWVAASGEFGEDASRVLHDILGTEISPELVPGRQLQSTQDTIGPYELHDFFLHYYLRGYDPSTIAFLAASAWGEPERGRWPQGVTERNSYTLSQVVNWLEVFIRRFHNNQFKRSCIPNGPKVCAAGALSPRGDWRMPSDVGPTAALRALEPARRAASARLVI